MSAALALSLWSCASERPVDAAAPTGTPALQFTIKTPVEPFVTRADIALNKENTINDFRVYTSENGQGRVALLVEGNDYALVKNSASSFTITMDESWLQNNDGKNVKFFFVGNAKTSFAKGDEVIMDNQSQYTGFEFARTKFSLTEIDSHTLVAPQYGGADMLFSATAEVSVAGTVKHSCQLKRREARFDIEVPADQASSFEITKIYVLNVPYDNIGLFPEGNDPRPEGFHDYETITSLGGGVSFAYDASTGRGTATNRMSSVFYLYPTVMQTPDHSANDGTMIQIWAKYNGHEAAYWVNTPAGTQIKANFRYLLRVNPVSGGVSMSAEEMTEGDTDDWNAEPLAGKNAYATFSDNCSDYGVNGEIVDMSATSSLYTVTVKSNYGTTHTLESFLRENSINDISFVKKTFTHDPVYYQVVETYEVGAPYMEAVGYVKLNITWKQGDGGTKTITISSNMPMRSNDIIYWDGERMQLGSWGWEVNQDNILYFKFGSLVGFTTKSMADTWDAGDVKYNPTGVAYDNYEDIPFCDMEEGVPSMEDGYISSSAYESYALVKSGRGDPCKLVGIAANEITSSKYSNGSWHLTSLQEIKSSGLRDYTWDGVNGKEIGHPYYTFLPYLMYRLSTGSVERNDASSYSELNYWSSATRYIPYSAFGLAASYPIGSDGTGVNSPDTGYAIRCAR
jgi:hypothetical protein